MNKIKCIKCGDEECLCGFCHDCNKCWDCIEGKHRHDKNDLKGEVTE